MLTALVFFADVYPLLSEPFAQTTLVGFFGEEFAGSHQRPAAARAAPLLKLGLLDAGVRRLRNHHS